MKTIIYRILILVLIFGMSVKMARSQTLSGTVYELDKDKHKTPLTGVNVYWNKTQIGTTTDANGKFVLSRPDLNEQKLIVSFIGYKVDTISIPKEQKKIDIVLSVNRTLKEVVIEGKQSGSFVSRIDPIYTQNITGKELRKAACCNLSESFETNASVDVTYSDAVSGAKQIQLLGLAGIYSQLMTENIPNLGGLATAYGLEYIPGPWMESIQISKGASSVVNGFESITGQINVEYKKPDNSEKFFANYYTNDMNDREVNFTSSWRINHKLSTMILGYNKNATMKMDVNKDGFIDKPVIKQFNFINGWKYEPSENFHAVFGIQALYEDRLGGMTTFNNLKKGDSLVNHLYVNRKAYGININTQRYQGYLKTGYIFPNKPESTVGFVTNATLHQQSSYFGLNNYDGEQRRIYSSLIYQSIIGNTNHKFSTGLNYIHDDYNENLNDSSFDKTEDIAGAFFQYTYSYRDKFTMIMGIRGDNHNKYGYFFTPRLHLKYDINKHNTLRASIGKGYRSPNIVAENIFLLASSRKLVFSEEPKLEEALNYGGSFTKHIDIIGKEMSLSAEFFRTEFINQILVDDESVDYIKFYNLNGLSYANNYQVEMNYELLKGLDMIAAIRWSDVKATYENGLERKPFVNRYKGLLNFSYTTNPKDWQVDFTTQFNGKSRLPDMDANPVLYRIRKESPAYTIINAQVTKYFKDWSIYVGGENLTNFTQKDPIIDSGKPFGEYFDASLVWGPIYGRLFYVGLRYCINHEKNNY